MARNAASSVGVLALLGLAVNTQFSPERGIPNQGQAKSSNTGTTKAGGGTKDQQVKGAKEKSERGSTESQPGEDTTEGPWLAIRKFFGTRGLPSSTVLN